MTTTFETYQLGSTPLKTADAPPALLRALPVTE